MDHPRLTRRDRSGSSPATARDRHRVRRTAPTRARHRARRSAVPRARSLGQPIGDRDDDDPLLAEAARQLTAYFAGELKEFDLPLRPQRHRLPAHACGTSSGRSATARRVVRRDRRAGSA